MYNIKTTININKELLKDIAKVSHARGKSRSEIIIMLLKNIMDKESNRANIHRSIKYQKRDDKKNWHRFHICLKGNVYEYCLDLKKILKMSLSHIVAHAAKKYLKNLLYEKNTDNYLFKNYVIAKEDADGIIYWKLFWGIPKKPEKFITF